MEEEENLMQVSDQCKMFSLLYKRMLKKYSEQNKLQKQVGLTGQGVDTTHAAIFVDHCMYSNEYVISYVRKFDCGADEILIEDLKDIITPSLFDHGMFIISGFKGSHKDYSQPKSSSPYEKNQFSSFNNSSFNAATSFSASSPTDETSSFPSLSIQLEEVVDCGTMFTTSEILCGGRREFHGKLGLKKKAIFTVQDLESLSSNHVLFFVKMFSQWVKTLSRQQNVPSLMIPVTPEFPKYLTALILFTKMTGKSINLHKLDIACSNNDNNRPMDRFFKSMKNSETSYKATFDIMKEGDMSMDNDERLNTLDETSLHVNFHWSSVESLPFQHPPHTSNIVLEIKILPGESRSPANDVYLELVSLDAITNTSISQMPQIFNNTQESYFPDTEKLSAFKQLVSDFSYYGVNDQIPDEDSTDMSPDLQSAMSSLIKEKFRRKDHDFTDKLWTFLRNSESTDHLISYLTDILHSVVNGSLQPAISPNNETKLAKFIRQMYLANDEETLENVKERILDFLSTDQAMFSLVGEIGFEKLRKDFFNFFMSNELAPVSSLMSVCKHATGHFDVTSLWKLHYCFEVIITPTIYLTLSQDCQRSLLAACLDYYSSHNIQATSPLFQFSLPPFHDSANAIHSNCEGRLAKTWQRGSIIIPRKDRKLSNVIHKRCIKKLEFDGDEHRASANEKVLYACENICLLPLCKNSGLMSNCMNDNSVN